ncbi:para-nitrobenzyl esterase [Streptosporangium becharense]|uniref:Carboxylic ester hydrolase n=1 Tax=Streptosporangium becharense TaxID=1816182 RepID=A0A7W9IK78_9ACTN|nr:carboxylesterase family protein [Streptosporangium becharense]MBB2913272.1 para-nitrobenzyl esterase [Streptosporangium becharense]MBB5822255.1 para-nitrobenzyl esterase [Streptosporangium becharense]
MTLGAGSGAGNGKGTAGGGAGNGNDADGGAAPLAHTALGTLRGVRSARVCAFRGVRYAAPARRLTAPSPAPSWRGIADAAVPGPPAPQRPGRMGWVPGLEIDPSTGREDCLHLNVWTPSCEGRRPVLVFLHGGAFVFGSGAQPMYDGTALARDHGLVVVTVNYRLGLPGFWYGDGVPANLALRDQIAALEWVRDNITAFGGDPAEVTLGGHSAGGTSVLALLTCAPGLFARAVAMSPVPYGFATPAEASAWTSAARRALGADPAAAPLEDLLAAESAAVRSAPPVGGLLPVAPVIDGDLLTAHPVDAIRSGDAAPVPLLVTTTTEETRLFVAIGGRDPGTREVFGRPAEEIVRMHRGPARHLVCAHRSPMSHGGVALGACHLVDVPLYLGTHGGPLTGSGPEVEELARSMTDEFARFCRGEEAEE